MSAARPARTRRSPAAVASRAVRSLAIAGLEVVSIVALGVAWAGPAAATPSPPPGSPSATAAPSAVTPLVAGPPPQLSIAISNGETSVKVGDRLIYTITVTNTGTTTAHALLISQTIPAGLQLVASDGEANNAAGTVSWISDLTPAMVKTFHTTTVLQTTGANLLRLATVACATDTQLARTLVCATDSDQLPVAAAAAGSAPAKADASRSRPNHTAVPTLLGAAALIGVAALSAVLVHRSRRQRPPRGVDDPVSAAPQGPLAHSSPLMSGGPQARAGRHFKTRPR
jgi:uncharacterized repeat protein (TIGR01451 family)